MFRRICIFLSVFFAHCGGLAIIEETEDGDGYCSDCYDPKCVCKAGINNSLVPSQMHLRN